MTIKNEDILKDILLEITLSIGSQEERHGIAREAVPLLLDRLNASDCLIISEDHLSWGIECAVPNVDSNSKEHRHIIETISSDIKSWEKKHKIFEFNNSFWHCFKTDESSVLILVWDLKLSDIQISKIKPICQFLYSTYRNVSEREKRLEVENQIKKERLLLRTVLDHIPDAIYLKDIKGRKILLNNSDLQNMGLDNMEDALYKTDAEVYPEEDGDSERTESEILKTGIPVTNRQEPLLNRKGESKWILTSKFPFRNLDGQIEGIVGIGRDITYQKQITEQLERLSLVASQSINGVIITDINGKIDWINEGFSKLTGYHIEEIKGKRPGEFLQGPKTDPATVSKMGRAISQKKGFKVEIINYKKNGREYWIEINCNPLTDEEGNVTGFMAIESDISIRKQYEEQLIKARKEAEQAKEDAVLAQQAEEMFLANMSHEIRTPLNAIIGMSSLLYDTKPNQEQLDYLQTLDSSANFLLGLISNILDITKIQSGKIDIRNVSFNIKELLRTLQEIYNNKVLTRPINFNLSVADDVPSLIYSDEILIQQILNNLMSNAEKFTFEGDVDIKLTKVKDIDDQEILLCFEIADSGIGIKEEDLQKIFNKFKQIENKNKIKTVGTGLGLAITKELTQLLKGEIKVQSTFNKGTIFTLEIPVKKASLIGNISHKINNDLLSNDSALNDINVLVVEDNLINIKYVEKVLNRLHIKHDIVTTGEDCLKNVNLSHYDIILLDIQLPDINGFEVCKTIRNGNSTNKDSVILALTASVMTNDKFKAREAGMDDFLSKPFKPIELINMMKSKLAQKGS